MKILKPFVVVLFLFCAAMLFIVGAAHAADEMKVFGRITALTATYHDDDTFIRGTVAIDGFPYEVHSEKLSAVAYANTTCSPKIERVYRCATRDPRCRYYELRVTCLSPVVTPSACIKAVVDPNTLVILNLKKSGGC